MGTTVTLGVSESHYQLRLCVQQSSKFGGLHRVYTDTQINGSREHGEINPVYIGIHCEIAGSFLLGTWPSLVH